MQTVDLIWERDLSAALSLSLPNCWQQDFSNKQLLNMYASKSEKTWFAGFCMLEANSLSTHIIYIHSKIYYISPAQHSEPSYKLHF
jgi:hypothetical protein